MKNRDKQRENKAKGKINEEPLSGKNAWGKADPTPMLAVDNIIQSLYADALFYCPE